MIICPGCGADMRFDPEVQKLLCDYCGKQLDPKEYHAPKAAEASEQDGFFEAHFYTCPQCGAEVVSTDETAATFCSYCGTSVLLEGRLREAKKPDRIIPFRRTKRDCEASYRKLIDGALFAPSEMKKNDRIERFRGIYMPYWIYSLDSTDGFDVKGTVSKRQGDYIVNSNYRIHSPVKATYRGIAYDASANFYDNLSNGIAPFHPETEGVDFDPAYLSGFYADLGDVDSKVYWNDVKEYAVNDIASKVSREFNYGKYSVDRNDLKKALKVRDGAKSGLFPVWFLALRSKNGERISYAVVNGETGKTAADIPIDFGKYLLGALIFAIPVFLLLCLLPAMTPFRMLLASTILALVSLVISNGQLNRIHTRENYLDDKGFQSVRKVVPPPSAPVKAEKSSSEKTMLSVLKVFTQILVWFVMFFVTAVVYGMIEVVTGSDLPVMILMIVYFAVTFFITKRIGAGFNKKMNIVPEKVVPASFGSKMPKLTKQLLAIFIAILVLLWNPAGDQWFYGAAGISMLLSVWSFRDIIKEQNLLSTRKIPQMNARGGDEKPLEA